MHFSFSCSTLFYRSFSILASLALSPNLCYLLALSCLIFSFTLLQRTIRKAAMLRMMLRQMRETRNQPTSSLRSLL